MFYVFNQDNMEFELVDYTLLRPDVVYADCVYESTDFSWVQKYWQELGKNGVFIIQTDWHTDAEYDVYMKKEIGATLINKVVWKNEWGRGPTSKFHQCYDTILIYCKGKSWKWNSAAIQVPKATTNTKLNPSGRTTKQATAWVNDICLTTTAKERVKKSDGHLAKWQKPMKLYDRIILPFVNQYSFVLDPFMGVGTLGRWCANTKLSYVGIEIDKEICDLALNNIRQEKYLE